MNENEIPDDYLLALGNHRFYCGESVWFDHSEMDFADPNGRPIIRSKADNAVHSCAARIAVGKDRKREETFNSPKIHEELSSKNE